MSDITLDQLVEKLTLEEKASLCSGLDMWSTKSVERLSIPSITLTDGPHGLRISSEPGKPGVKTTCFPSGCGLAASWNPDLLKAMGTAIAEECLAENVGVLLGPAVNIKRSPLCGRNFEYYSEDPLLSGRLASGHIQGVQSKGVGTSIKHFALNNQETERFVSNSVCDERTMREIYLASFEWAVKEAKPWTVMCSYNKINGTHASDNHWLLNDVLRNDWGFDGFVMTDWGALNDRLEGIRAGLELEMPGSGGVNDMRLVEAVQSGELDEKVLDVACRRILNIVMRIAGNPSFGTPYDKDAHHELARKFAGESMVLLKNEDHLLPINPNSTVAVIGSFAEKPRYQGGGSSHIQPWKLDIPIDEIKKVFPNSSYHAGFDMDSDDTDPKLLAEALESAAKADCAVVFVGLPDRYESEGYDRMHMQLPANQSTLIAEIAKIQPKLAVVLMNGSPVEMPWIKDVKSILEAYLGGQGAGGALADILSGKINPSGKLAETFPLKLAHNPSYLNFPGESKITRYNEGVFVGYRYYETKGLDVLFPFGHGLSFTQFTYSDLRLSTPRMIETETVTVTMTVENSGDVPGSEIVQLYIAPPTGSVKRPTKELKDFGKIFLQPGEKKEITFSLDRRAFAFWSTDLPGRLVESGEYSVLVGSSSQDIRLQQKFLVDSAIKAPKRFDRDTTLGELLSLPETKPIAQELFDNMLSNSHFSEMDGAEFGVDDFFAVLLKTIPLRSMILFSQGLFSEAMMNTLLSACNATQKKKSEPLESSLEF